MKTKFLVDTLVLSALIVGCTSRKELSGDNYFSREDFKKNQNFEQS